MIASMLLGILFLPSEFLVKANGLVYYPDMTMSLVVGERVFVNCGMEADPRRHKVMVRYISGKL